jgi:3-methylcrotonyl-CoA carboxylase alpha subunit
LLWIAERSIRGVGERQPDGGFSFLIDGVRRKIELLEHGPETVVLLDGESWRLVEVDPLAAHAGEDPTAGRLTAPMPGRVIQLMVEPGSRIQRGQPLMLIEAMKMEHTVSAPADGVVEAVRYGPGDLVEEGAELIALAPADHVSS